MIIEQNTPAPTENNLQTDLTSNGFVLKNSATTMAFGVLSDAAEGNQVCFLPNQTGNYLIELEDVAHCLIVELQLTDGTSIPFAKQETTSGWLITTSLTDSVKCLIKLTHNLETPFRLKEYLLKIQEVQENQEITLLHSMNRFLSMTDVNQLCKILLFKDNTGGIAFGKLNNPKDENCFNLNFSFDQGENSSVITKYSVEIEDINHMLTPTLLNNSCTLADKAWHQTSKGWITNIDFAIEDVSQLKLTPNPSLSFTPTTYVLKLTAQTNDFPSLPAYDLCKVLVFKNDLGDIAFGNINKADHEAFFSLTRYTTQQSPLQSKTNYTIEIEDANHVLIPTLLNIEQVEVNNIWQQTPKGWLTNIDTNSTTANFLKLTYNSNLDFIPTAYVVKMLAEVGDFPNLVKIVNSQATTEYLLQLSLNNLSKTSLNFKLKYDPTKFLLLNLAAQNQDDQLAIGPIGDSGLEVTAVNTINGEINFKFSKPLEEEDEWTGNLTVLKFKALANGNITMLLTEQL